MTEISFEEIKDEVHQYLLESSGPVYSGEIEAQTGLSHRELGQALMSLFGEDRVEWPSGDEWVAVAENSETIQMIHGEMRVAYV